MCNFRTNHVRIWVHFPAVTMEYIQQERLRLSGFYLAIPCLCAMGFPLKALISVTRNKQFLLQIASEENRLVISPELLGEPLKKCVPFFVAFLIFLSQRRFFRRREKDRKELRKEKLQTLPEASFQIHGIYSVVPRFATNLVNECFLNVSTNCLNSKMCFPTVIHWTYFLRKTTTSSQWWADLSLIGGCCVWIQFTQRIAFSIVVRCTFDFNKFLIFQCQRVSRFQHCKSHRSHQSQDRQGSSHLNIFELFVWQVGISRSGNSDRAFGISRFISKEASSFAVQCGRPSFCPTVDTTHFGISSSTSVFQERNVGCI